MAKTKRQDEVSWYQAEVQGEVEGGDLLLAVVRSEPDGRVYLDCGHGLDPALAREVAETVLRLLGDGPEGEDPEDPEEVVDMTEPESKEWNCRVDGRDSFRLDDGLGEVEFAALRSSPCGRESAVLDANQVREVRDWLDQWLRWRATQNEEEE